METDAEISADSDTEFEAGRVMVGESDKLRVGVSSLLALRVRVPVGDGVPLAEWILGDAVASSLSVTDGVRVHERDFPKVAVGESRGIVRLIDGDGRRDRVTGAEILCDGSLEGDGAVNDEDALYDPRVGETRSDVLNNSDMLA